MTAKTKFDIAKAVYTLGKTGMIKLYASGDIIRVDVDGSYFGLWHVGKNTFVD